MTKETTWKVLAIIFIILFIIENLIIGWGLIENNREVEETYDCYYNFCVEDYDSDYDLGICTCYNLDVLGDYYIEKTKYYN